MNSTLALSHDAKLRVMAARIIAQSRWPYTSTILFSLKLVESNEVETLAVDDGWRMYFSPTFVLKHGPDELATMVLHEAMHCLLQHSARFKAINQPYALHPNWNVSGDVGINHTLDEARMNWGEFTPVRFKDLSKFKVTNGMSTEQIYFLIDKHLEQHPEDGTPVSDCGSVIGGGRRKYELPASDPDSSAVKKDHQDVLRDRTAQDILDHSQKFPGTIPGDVLRWAQELLNPKVDWRRELAGSFRTSLATLSGRRDYVYTRPSRRQSAMRVGNTELILPAMRKPAPPSVAIIVDTSGSISTEMLTQFLSEVDGLARANGVSQGLNVIPCDASVGPVQRIKSRASITELVLPGGGGTDMGVGILAATQLKPLPRIIIVLTDGYTPWPESVNPKVDRVIICLTDSANRGSAPAWADEIMIDEG
jgi:predicted metal-dependent peptidase